MKPSIHALASAGAAAVSFALTSSAETSLAIVVSGVFIDIDHVFDYLREYGFRPRPVFFYSVFRRIVFKRLFLIFHSWELLATLWALTFLAQTPPILLGCAIGITLHLIMDQIGNQVFPLTYFITWRLRHGFLADRIVKHRRAH